MTGHPNVASTGDLEWMEQSHGEKFGFKRRSLSAATGGGCIAAGQGAGGGAQTGPIAMLTSLSFQSSNTSAETPPGTAADTTTAISQGLWHIHHPHCSRCRIEDSGHPPDRRSSLPRPGFHQGKGEEAYAQPYAVEERGGRR